MTRRHPLWRIVALLTILAFVAAACGGDDDDDGDEETGGGNTTETTAADDGGGGDTLAGMRGTTPLTELDDAFKDRMLEVDPDLKDFNYGAESYDIVVVLALSAELAKTDGIDMAKQINGVTRNGEKCESWEDCKALIDGGTTDIDYDGVAGPLEFSGNGEPTVGSYGILEFKDDNKIDDAKTEYRVIDAPAEADVDEVPVQGTRAGDGVLKLGELLPETGSLAFLGPPEFAGVDLAVKEINDAGGVLGKPIEVVRGDSGDTSTDTASQTVDRLLNENVDAVVGAASSSVSLTVIDKIVNAGVVQFSPANTSKKFSTYDDKGLYYRNAPSDILQGQLLGELIVEEGNATVGILALDDDYGTGLADDATKALEEGGAEVVKTIIYDPAATGFDAEVQEMKGEDPDAILLIGFDESSRVLATMVEQGIGPSDKAVYGVDGNMGNALGENFEAGK
jgi:hypothetical protein